MIQPKPRWETVAVYGIPILISIVFAWVYITMHMQGIYGGDAGDLTTTSYVWGIPHPPGYPLYTFLSGLVMRLIPFGTVAWKACFLSSIPSALALFFLWRVCFRCTSSLFASTVATVLYGLTGPVWLNAISQEVFGLYSFISSVFLERLLTWFEQKKRGQLLFLAFWTGIAFTHQYLIAFSLLPAFLFIIWRRRDLLPSIIHSWWKIIVLFFLGFLPYIYAPIVSSIGTLFDMEHAASLQGFFRLILRASYGTFQATAGAPPMLLNRLLNVYTFFQFVIRDFSLVGVFSIALGLIFMRKKRTNLYDFVTLSLLSWILFFLLAGFSQLLTYHIGTSIRFFIAPYHLITLCISYGLGELAYRNKRILVVFAFFLLLVVAVFPMVRHNYRAFHLLRTDTSMEQLANDIALSAPEKSILFLFEDTTAYAMYYAYFVKHIRPDLTFVFFRWLGNAHYRSMLRASYPELVVPEPTDPDYRKFIELFVRANSATFPLVSDTESDILSGTWVPNGLLFRYIPDNTIPVDHAAVVKQTAPLWENFSPPLQLIPFQKEIPMIADVLRVYAQHRAIVVREMALADLPIETITAELHAALALEMNVVPEAYLYPVVLLYEKKRCEDAKMLLSVFVKKWGYDRLILRQYYKWNKACGSDSEVDPLAAFYMQRFPKDIE